MGTSTASCAMYKVHSHYENLKVERNASPEAIRTAYRSLSSKYHPDRNHGDAEASRIMSVVNVAYGVLSDPVKKLEHDQWIQQAEREGSSAAPPRAGARRNAKRRVSPYTLHQRVVQEGELHESEPYRLPPVFALVARHWATKWLALGLAGLVIFQVLRDDTAAWPRGWKPQVASVAPIEAPPPARYVRSPEAPNGHRWPAKSGYVDGYEQRNTGGLSEVTIDNTHNESDMFAKVVSLEGTQPDPVRMVLVRAHSSFKVTGLITGTYDVRYRNLVDGRLSRSQFFTLEEVKTDTGTSHSRMTVNLHQVRDGTLHSYGLTEAEF